MKTINVHELINMKATMVKRAIREGLEKSYYMKYYYSK